jgi:hypothetical protein
VVDEPWLTAPGRVFTRSKEVRLLFSAPVDRASVEARLKETLTRSAYQTAWQSDQELVVTAKGGCSYFEVSAAGAKDARGRTLEPAQNPELQWRLPCHPGFYPLVGLPDGKAYPGFPTNAWMVDTHPASGRLLGSNGTIYFMLEGGTVRPFTHTAESQWAIFTADGNVLLADDRTVRLVAPDGKDLQQAGLAGAVIEGILSPDGKEAVLLVNSNEQAGFQRLDLAAWTVTEWQALGRPVAYAALNWVTGKQQVHVLWREGAPSLLDLTTGEVRPVSGSPRVSSPDGRWVVDPNLGAIVGPDARSVVLTDAMRATVYPYALWAPDSKHVLLPGGQVIAVETGLDLSLPESPHQCASPRPSGLGIVGADLVAQYVVDCG